jgi:uncharacterized protein YaaW (UPF0174 family)
VNLFRRNGVNYSEIVDDVASHLKMKVPADASVEEKEALIIDCVFTSSWKKCRMMSAARFCVNGHKRLCQYGYSCLAESGTRCQ